MEDWIVAVLSGNMIIFSLFDAQYIAHLIKGLLCVYGDFYTGFRASGGFM